MSLAKEPAYKVKDLAERIGNDAVYEAVFSDLFEGKLTGKTYMLDYDENDQDFGGNFIRHFDDPVDDPAPRFDDFLKAHPEKNHNEPSRRYGVFLEFLSTIPARDNEPSDGWDEFLAIENPTREDYLNCKKAHDEYWATVVNTVPVLRLWTREMFREAFVAFNRPKANLKTPFSDIAKISWEAVDQIFKNYLTGTKTAKGVHMGGLYLSEIGLNEWLERHGQKWPLGLKPSARIPDSRKRGRNAPGALVSAARAARNKIKNNPNSQQAGKTKISWIFRELQKSRPEVLEKKAGGIKSEQTIRRELGNKVDRPKWDKD